MVDPLTLSAVSWGVATAGWIISPIVTRLLNRAFSRGKSSKPETLHQAVTRTLPLLALALEAAEGSEHMKRHFEELMRELKSAFSDMEGILNGVDYVCHEKQLITREKHAIFPSVDDAGTPKEGIGFKSSCTIPGPLDDRLKKNMDKIEELIDEAHKTMSGQTCQSTMGMSNMDQMLLIFGQQQEGILKQAYSSSSC